MNKRFLPSVDEEENVVQNSICRFTPTNHFNNHGPWDHKQVFGIRSKPSKNSPNEQPVPQ